MRLHGNAPASDAKATEACLLRCAEVTLSYGFSYFVVLDSPNKLTTTTPVDTSMGMSSHPAGGVSSLMNSKAGLPSAANTIACFRSQPARYPEAFEAEAVFNRLSGRYGAQKRSEVRANPIDASPLQFSLGPDFLFLPMTTPDQIVFLEPDAAQRTVVIGVLNEWENPCKSLAEFRRKAAVTAAILGAQAVQIQSNSRPAQGGRPGGKNGFAAALLLVPKARLGLQDEGGAWPRTELLVRGFDKESLAPGAGLKVGDQIVALNGVDVLREKRFVDGWLSWAVGDSVVVTFLRDGIEMSLQAKTIPN